MKSIPTFSDLGVSVEQQSILEEYFKSFPNFSLENFPQGIVVVVSADPVLRAGLEYAILKMYRDAFGNQEEVGAGGGIIIENESSYDVSEYSDFTVRIVEPGDSTKYLQEMKQAVAFDAAYMLVGEVTTDEQYLFALQAGVTGRRVIVGINGASLEDWISQNAPEATFVHPDMVITAPNKENVVITIAKGSN